MENFPENILSLVNKTECSSTTHNGLGKFEKSMKQDTIASEIKERNSDLMQLIKNDDVSLNLSTNVINNIIKDMNNKKPMDQWLADQKVSSSLHKDSKIRSTTGQKNTSKPLNALQIRPQQKEEILRYFRKYKGKGNIKANIPFKRKERQSILKSCYSFQNESSKNIRKSFIIFLDWDIYQEAGSYLQLQRLLKLQESKSLVRSLYIYVPFLIYLKFKRASKELSKLKVKNSKKEQENRQWLLNLNSHFDFMKKNHSFIFQTEKHFKKYCTKRMKSSFVENQAIVESCINAKACTLHECFIGISKSRNMRKDLRSYTHSVASCNSISECIKKIESKFDFYSERNKQNP